ncbi:MAG: DegT/DnrJ/EryC1/StrS family aminotransferase [Myxococcales bacterium]|nr:DegT/DnrJ/EryC1/StrS family aminotransferase [Myxococcales bacterium]
MKTVPLVDLSEQLKRLSPELEASISAVLERGDFIQGQALQRFEENFSRYVGCRSTVGVNSGTDALRLSLLALGVAPGDEVILPVNTFFATGAAVSSVGARPVFVDVDKSDANLDCSQLEAAITARTRAVIGVHLFGRLCDTDAISEVCRRRGLAFIEDAAQAHGASRGGRRAGAFGDAAAFSFYPGKNLGACGDGGAVTTDDPDLADRLFKLRNFGQQEKHHHELLGLNSRLDTIQAALLDVKLRYLDEWTQARRSLAAAYARGLSGLEGVEVLTRPDNEQSVFHLFVIRVPERDRVLTALNESGIGAQVHYPLPLHRQPAFAYLDYPEGAFPVAEQLSRDILSLPLYPELSEVDQEHVMVTLTRILNERS